METWPLYTISTHFLPFAPFSLKSWFRGAPARQPYKNLMESNGSGRYLLVQSRKMHQIAANFTEIVDFSGICGNVVKMTKPSQSITIPKFNDFLGLCSKINLPEPLHSYRFM